MFLPNFPACYVESIEDACEKKPGMQQYLLGAQLKRRTTMQCDYACPCSSKQMLFTTTGSMRSLRQAAILGKLVKTTVAPQVDAAMPRCGARRQSGKHRLNLGSTAPQAFVIWRRSSRQVAAVVGCSPRTVST